MAAETPPPSLDVELQHPEVGWVKVGTLSRSDESCWFETSAAYWDLAGRPVLGQVFEDRGPEWRPTARVALPTWFSHLLPEGRLRQAVAAAADVNEQREYFLLARIGGDDLPGALRVLPGGSTPGAAPDPDEEPDKPGDESSHIKFSLAGVQLKFSVAVEGRGLTVPARGKAGTWIAKLPDQRPDFRGVPEAELAGLVLAGEVGIEVPVAKLVDVDEIQGLPDWATVGGGRALLIERFDRRAGDGRIHVEELAQVLSIPTGRDTFKYEHLNFETVARVVAALCGPAAVSSVIDRIVLNVLIGNGDAHAKNWAFCYEDGRTPTLSPAYDVVPTILYLPKDDLGLNLNGSKAFARVGLSAFERLAEKAGWDGAEGRRSAVEAGHRVLGAWPVLEGYLDAGRLKALTAHRDSLPFVREL